MSSNKSMSFKLEPELPMIKQLTLNEEDIESINSDPDSGIVQVTAVKKQVEFVINDDDLQSLADEFEADSDELSELSTSSDKIEPAHAKDAPMVSKKVPKVSLVKAKEFEADENGIFDSEAMLASSMV